MDSVVHYAVEEICSQGVNGLTLRNLWPKLQHTLSSNDLHLCDNVKRALWTNLLNIPGLQFESRGVSYNSEDSSIQSFEDCERLELKIVAAEHLRNSYVGIYDIKASDAGISLPQRRALERLAIARYLHSIIYLLRPKFNVLFTLHVSFFDSKIKDML